MTHSFIALKYAPLAQMVKLVDTLASGASARKGVEVQVLFWAPIFLEKPSFLARFFYALWLRISERKVACS